MIYSVITKSLNSHCSQDLLVEMNINGGVIFFLGISDEIDDLSAAEKLDLQAGLGLKLDQL